MKIVSVAQMRALEAAAFASGISEAALQEQAGIAVAEEAFRLLAPEERVAVLIGHGNNGRDGAVAAEWLLRHQTPVDLMLAPRHAVTVDEMARLKSLGASIVAGAWGTHLRRARLAIDAIAGIGVRGPLHEPLAFMVPLLNLVRAERPGQLRVVAVDIPSGIDPDSGALPGQAVAADLTVTLGGVKQGLLRFPAAERVGRLVPRELGIPSSAVATLPYNCLVETDLGRLLPPRPLDAHKYRFGRVLVVAGSDHFPGAAVLCTAAAARVGAGLVTLAASPDVRLAVAAHTPSVTYTQQDVHVTHGTAAAEALQPYVQSHSAILLGPGLGRAPGTTDFVRSLLQGRPRERPLVIDADGLVALGEIADWQALIDDRVVLTPHTGELERLTGEPLNPGEPLWVQTGRLAQKWRCVLVAKGPFTCIGRPDGRVDVWPHANPALATGGTGDVLAGVTAGLLAQHVSPWDAARLAVGVHARAAERVVGRGWRTLLASDLPSELPAALEDLATLTGRR